MKHFAFFIMLPFTASAHAQKPDETPKDTIVQIDGEIYELKTWSRYQVVKDTSLSGTFANPNRWLCWDLPSNELTTKSCAPSWNVYLPRLS